MLTYSYICEYNNPVGKQSSSSHLTHKEIETVNGLVKGRQNCKVAVSDGWGLGPSSSMCSLWDFGFSHHLSGQCFLTCKTEVMMPILTGLRGRLNEIMYAKALVQCLAFPKWQLLFIQQVFMNHLLWTEHQVLKVKQSKVPVLLVIAVGRTLSGRGSSQVLFSQGFIIKNSKHIQK